MSRFVMRRLLIAAARMFRGARGLTTLAGAAVAGAAVLVMGFDDSKKMSAGVAEARERKSPVRVELGFELGWRWLAPGC